MKEQNENQGKTPEQYEAVATMAVIAFTMIFVIIVGILIATII